MTKWVKFDTGETVENADGGFDKLYHLDPENMTDPDRESAMITVFTTELADKVIAALNKENVDING